MQATIWKFEIPAQDRFKVIMPKKHKIVHVAVQNNVPCMWAQVGPYPTLAEEVDNAEFNFRLVGTGHPIPDIDQLEHVGSFQLHGGALVFHLYLEV